MVLFLYLLRWKREFGEIAIFVLKRTTEKKLFFYQDDEKKCGIARVTSQFFEEVLMKKNRFMCDVLEGMLVSVQDCTRSCKLHMMLYT